MDEVVILGVQWIYQRFDFSTLDNTTEPLILLPSRNMNIKNVIYAFFNNKLKIKKEGKFKSIFFDLDETLVHTENIK